MPDWTLPRSSDSDTCHAFVFVPILSYWGGVRMLTSWSCQTSCLGASLHLLARLQEVLIYVMEKHEENDLSIVWLCLCHFLLNMWKRRATKLRSYSASLWTSNFSISLWERHKTHYVHDFWIFRTYQWLSKPTSVYFGRQQNPPNNLKISRIVLTK